MVHGLEKSGSANKVTSSKRETNEIADRVCIMRNKSACVSIFMSEGRMVQNCDYSESRRFSFRFSTYSRSPADGWSVSEDVAPSLR